MSLERRNLRTARLVLEPYKAEHIPAVWKAIRLSQTELSPWMPWASNATLQATHDFCTRTQTQWDDGVAYEFVFLLNDEVVGAGGLHAIVPLVAKGEIGYWVRTDQTGHGLCTEAAEAIRDFGFEHVRLHRLELRAGIENLASRRVAEKLGFLLEGRLRDGGAGADGFHDTALYAMLSSDPRP